jgi:trehalose synthase
MQDVGLDAHWNVIFGKEEFFNATKLLHNSLQGADETLSEEQWEVFDEINAINAEGLEGEWDTIIVHDPQPIGLRQGAADKSRNWIWRCHIDLSEPNPASIGRLLPQIQEYDATVWHMPAYVPNAIDGHDGVRIIPPAIDPLSPKNMAFSPDDAAFVCNQFGIDVDRPLLTQVSRFDPWKDPLGVIDAYRQVKQTHPDVQLALVGAMAHDDPEGWEFYNQTVTYAAGDPDIFILSNLNNVGSVEVNAFQVHSSVNIQKSIREGFGLTVTEALWKSRPIVAGRVGGIVAQIEDGVTGWLVDSVAECAEACLAVLADPAAARARALRGKENVRRKFLTPRLLRDWLVLFNVLLGNDTGGSEITLV